MKKIVIATVVVALATGLTVANAAVVKNINPISIAKVAAAPPAAVLSSFHAIFGNVPVRQWKQRSNNQWRAHFTRNGVAWEATFTSTGVLVKSERA